MLYLPKPARQPKFDGWYPKGGWDTWNGFRARIKYNSNGECSEMFIANGNFTDSQADDKHLHVLRMNEPGNMTLTFTDRTPFSRQEHYRHLSEEVAMRYVNEGYNG